MLFFDEFVKKMRKIKIFKIDYSFFIVFVIAFLLEEVILYFYFALFTVLHELTHFIVARKLGYLPRKIHLTFFGASLEGDDDFSISDEIKIVLAGPLFNLFIVIFCYLMFWFNPESFGFLYDVLIANWSILIFNFLPIYPLDAGRLMLVLFNLKYNRLDSLNKTKRCSFMFLSFMFLIFLISFFVSYNFTLGFICVNLALLTFSSSKDTAYKRQVFVERKYKKLTGGLIERVIYVDEHTPHFKLFKFIDDYHFVNFVFLDSEFNEVDRLSEVELYKISGLI